MRRRCIRCGVPDGLHLGLRISPTVNLCDWDSPQVENWPTRRPTCVDLFAATFEPRGVGVQAALVLLDKWESAGFPVPQARYFKLRHMVLLDPKLHWPRFRRSGAPIHMEPHRPKDSIVEVRLGSYNNQWWFPVEPHL